MKRKIFFAAALMFLSLQLFGQGRATYINADGTLRSHFRIGKGAGQIEWDSTQAKYRVVAGTDTFYLAYESWVNLIDTTGTKTYYQASAPTAGINEGDLWCDTDDFFRVYRYNGATWNLYMPGIFGNPSSAGLYLTSDYMGYYNGFGWKTYADASGNASWGDVATGGNGILWTQGTGALSLKGSVNITNTTTFANGGALSLDDVSNGSTYAKILATSISAGKILLSQVTGNLDDINNGSYYGKVLLTDIQSGHIKLSETVGTLDDIDNGSTFGKILLTDIQSGHVKLSEAYGTFDDIDNGSVYGKVLLTDITSGHIKLSECYGSLDDIDNGSTYGRVALTDISAGHITVVSSSASININSTTYGNQGIQFQYNNGTPRAYIGDGSNQYFKFDGTNVSWKGTNSSLSTAGLFTASNAVITGSVTITNVSTFANGSALSTADLNNASSWDNTATALTSGVSLSAGGMTLGTSASIKSGMTSYTDATNAGYFLGLVSSVPKLRLQTASAASYFDFTGTALNLYNVTVNSSTVKTATSGARMEFIPSDNIGNSGARLAIYNSSGTEIGGVTGKDAGQVVMYSATGISTELQYGYSGGGNYFRGTSTYSDCFYTNVKLLGEGGLEVGSTLAGTRNFVVNSSGQITEVNNLEASGYTGCSLVSDGTSYSPSTSSYSGSYYNLISNTQASNTSALGGFYAKANQGGSQAGAALQVFASQYSDATLAGYARLVSDAAMNGIVIGVGSSDIISFRVNNSEILKIGALGSAPSSSSDTGTASMIRITSDYIYVCTATNTWKRAALSSF